MPTAKMPWYLWQRVNTRNILFICGGAFPDLDEIIKERLTKTASIGFNSELKDKYDKDTDILSKVTVEDIRKFGMIPEFIGRLPIICTLQDALSKDMLVTDPERAEECDSLSSTRSCWSWMR